MLSFKKHNTKSQAQMALSIKIDIVKNIQTTVKLRLGIILITI